MRGLRLAVSDRGRDDAGRAISGPMSGAQLTPAPMRTSFWFSIVGAISGLELQRP